MSRDESPITAALRDALEDFGAPADDRALAFYPRNDLGLARRFLARFGGDIRQTPEMGVLVWDGVRWALDQNAARARIMAQRSAVAIGRLELRALEDDPPPGDAKETEKLLDGLRAFASAACNSAKLSAALTEALPHVQAPLETWNARPDILNCPNTALSLTPEGVRPIPHDRAHMVTRLAAARYDPAAECPRWDEFIARVMPDPDERRYLQRVAGACLTDSSSDQKLIVHHGAGANGKSTFWDAVCHVLGDYAMTVDVASLLYGGEKQGSAASPDIARLAEGPRLVRASEPELGSRLSESHVKSITGGEPIVARMLHRPPMEFRPAFKIQLSCNSRPSIRGGDDGIWRRIDLLHWKVQIPPHERDPRLAEKLKAEASGILNWLIRGLEDWMETGLATPESVLASTAEYREDSDALGRFILEWCERDSDAEIEAGELHRAFSDWCKIDGANAVNANNFGRRLTDRGFERRKSNGKTYRGGLRLSAAGREAWRQWEMDNMPRGRGWKREDGDAGDE